MNKKELEFRNGCVESVKSLNKLEISQYDFDKLLEYSTSLPTGQHDGKRWKKNMVWNLRNAKPVWAVFEYGKTFIQNGQELRKIHHYNPIITPKKPEINLRKRFNGNKKI